MKPFENKTIHTLTTMLVVTCTLLWSALAVANEPAENELTEELQCMAMEAWTLTPASRVPSCVAMTFEGGRALTVGNECGEPIEIDIASCQACTCSSGCDERTVLAAGTELTLDLVPEVAPNADMALAITSGGEVYSSEIARQVFECAPMLDDYEGCGTMMSVAGAKHTPQRRGLALLFLGLLFWGSRRRR